MHLLRRLALVSALAPLALSVSAATADEPPAVVASIKPVHSLVAGVMAGVGEPHLLVAGGDSPHTYAMRPSDADALSRADAVFWIGDAMETFLPRSLANVAANTVSVELAGAPGLVLYDYENGHDHHHDDGHGHSHGDASSHGHAHGDGGEHDHGHDHDHAGHAHHDHDHDHTGLDAHIWLDPANARAMVAVIADTLAEIDPAHADIYRTNAAAMTERLQALEADIATRLAPYSGVAFFTFHEAFRYFAERFDLDSRGAITISPERQPGAQRLNEIRAEIGGAERVCVFSEPQFPPRLVETVVDGTNARTGVVDPLGADIADGPELYFELLELNAEAFESCFAATS